MCHSNTHHETTEETSNIYSKKPLKIIKNVSAPFSMTIKLRKANKSHPCKVITEWFHNHLSNSLHVHSFKDILPETVAKVKDYFDKGFLRGKSLQVIKTCYIKISKLLCKTGWKAISRFYYVPWSFFPVCTKFQNYTPPTMHCVWLH